MTQLSEREREVVTLIRAGFTRKAIARILGIPEDGFEGQRETVRGIVNDLCAEYDCRMDRLPEAIEKANGKG